jgi:hypothetical protein
MSGAAVRPRVVVALGVAQTLAWGSTYYLPAILAAPQAAAFSVPTAVVFAAFSLALAVSAALGPAAGRWIDRRGGRGALTVSTLVFAAGLGGMAAAQGPVGLAAAWVVIGAGMAIGLYEAAFAALAAAHGRGARAAITGVTLVAGFASTVCWPVTAWIEAEAGWRAACLFWAAAHLLVGLPLNRLFAPTAVQPPRPVSEAAPAEGERDAMRAATTLLAFVFAATWIVSTAMAAHLPRLLELSGAAPAAAIAAAALVGPAQVAARVAEFGLLRRLHPLVSAQAAAALHPLGAAALMIAGAPAAALFAVLHGAGNGVMTIAKGTLPLAIFGADGYGRRLGALMAPARFGSAAAPFGFGLMVDAWGAWTFAATAALGLAAVAALRALGRTAVAGGR